MSIYNLFIQFIYTKYLYNLFIQFIYTIYVYNLFIQNIYTIYLTIKISNYTKLWASTSE
jgi:hypothetical protein